MASSNVKVFQDIPGVEGVAKVTRMIAQLPPAIMDPIKPAIQAGAEQILATQKTACPVNDLDPTPGALRDSGHTEAVESASGAAVAVIFDAKDEKGRYYGKHVEHGHKTPHGTHVPPEPFFWPGYQHEKKSVKSRVGRAMGVAVKSVAGSGNVD